MRVCMVGAGYVGLVTGAGLAEFGNDVVCADTDPVRVGILKSGGVPIYEPGLEDIIASNVADERLSFTEDVYSAIRDCDVIFIAVGTPQSIDGSADLSHVYQVARTIGDVLQKESDQDKVVVIKSTVPVGTAATVRRIIQSYSANKFCVASNPEFLREGTAIQDFMRPDRVVIGTDCEKSRDALMKLYRPLSGATRFHHMDNTSAELVKYASNALLAARISFMNELSNFAVRIGADINLVREGVGSDSRIGNKYLYPGPGYGGSCLPKDVSALLYMAKSYGMEFKTLEATIDANERQKHRLSQLVFDHLGSVRGRKVTVWGAAFKAETDDIRESPALAFIDDMLAAGASVTVHDPAASANIVKKYGDSVHVVHDMYDALDSADVLAVCTEWRQYRAPDVQEIRRRSPDVAVFDGRNIWDASDFRSGGLSFAGICLPENAVSPSASIPPSILRPEHNF